MNLGTFRKFPSATAHRRADGAVHTYAFWDFWDAWGAWEVRVGHDVTHKAHDHAYCARPEGEGNILHVLASRTPCNCVQL